MLNPRNLLRGLSAITMAIGVVLALPTTIAVIYAEYGAVLGFAAPMVILTSVGFIAYRILGFPVKLTHVEAIVISSIGWLLAAAYSSIPYIVVLGVNFVDAYFEAISSLTTTGMTILQTLEEVPKSILLWRALGEWIGGAGIILLTTLLILSREGIIAWRLYVSEARDERLAPTIKDTIRRIWLIYVFYTAVCALALMFLGLNSFDAICHALACLSTGGFSTKTSNVGAFNSAAVEIVLVLFMVMGAIRFSLHHRLFTGGLREFVKDFELRAFIAILAIASLVISLDLAISSGSSFIEAFRIGFFHAISVGTTTGFTTKDLTVFPPLSKVVFLTLMIVGGCLNSTAGGLKVWRFMALLSVSRYEVERLFLPPGAVRSLKVGGRILGEDEILRVATIFFIYVLFALIATAAMVSFEGNFLESLSAVLSAMATVGPFYGSPISLSLESKVVLIISMWAGRLELIHAFLLFTPKLWRREHRHLAELSNSLSLRGRLSKMILGF
ncbi:MAG: TrkH family potassium uptake protein [Candidatus Nezhaarchaeales archaeon]